MSKQSLLPKQLSTWETLQQERDTITRQLSITHGWAPTGEQRKQLADRLREVKRELNSLAANGITF